MVGKLQQNSYRKRLKSLLRGYQVIIARSRRLCCNPVKNVKTSTLFTIFSGLLRQLLCNFLAMMSKVSIIFSLIFFSNVAIADPEIAESLKCSKLFPHFEKKFNIPSNTLHSIALKESGKKHKTRKITVVWPWTVNVEGKGHYFNSKREAISFVRKQIIRGRENIDVGCMQINLKHHLEAFNSLEQAFEPNNNVRYGAEFLRSKYDQLKSWHKAIAHYHSATHSRGFKYKQDVVKIASNMALYKASLHNYLNNNEEVVNDNPPKNSSNFNGNSKVQKKSLFSSNKRYRSSMMVPIPNKIN